MQLMPPLLADVDWIQIVIVIFFLAGPLLSQLGGGDKKPKQKQAGRQQARPRPPQAPPPGRQQAGGQQALQKEIDDFLRQAQNRRGQQQQQRPPQQRPPQRPPRQPQPRKPARQGLAAEQDAARRRAKQEALKRKKAEQLAQARGNRESIAEHVDAHIKSKPVSDHAKQLGRSLAQADESVEAHLHEVFDHKIGELGVSTAATTDIREGTDAGVWDNLEQRRARQAAAVQSRSADIARIIRDPISMREAIILGEILKPPKSLE